MANSSGLSVGTIVVSRLQVSIKPAPEYLWAWLKRHALANYCPLQLYERNWRHVDRAALSEGEAALIDKLSREIGGGRLLV